MEIKGLTELKNALRNMRERAKQVCRNATENSVRTILYPDVISRAPVRTGELKGTIRQEGSKVICDSPHALHVEYGTSKMPAQPFMGPALAENKDTLFHDAADQIVNGIENIGKK